MKARLLSFTLFAIAALLIAACGTRATPAVSPTETTAPTPEAPQATSPVPLGKATPVSEFPAAGICDSVAGDAVDVNVNFDIPSPRCVKVNAAQILTVHNTTSDPIDISFGPFSAHIEPAQSFTFDTPFGDYLEPGVHRVVSSLYSGPEVWLDISDATRYHNVEGEFSLKLPEGWRASDPLTVSNDPTRPYTLYILGTEPEASGGPGSSSIVIADAAQWTPEDFVQSQCSTCDAHLFEDVTLGGRAARRTQVGGGSVPFTTTWTFVENNGKLIALAIHDPESLQPLEAVIQSIQFD